MERVPRPRQGDQRPLRVPRDASASRRCRARPEGDDEEGGADGSAKKGGDGGGGEEEEEESADAAPSGEWRSVFASVEYYVLQQRRMFKRLLAALPRAVRARGPGDPAGRRVPTDVRELETFCMYSRLPVENMESRKSKARRPAPRCARVARSRAPSCDYVGVRCRRRARSRLKLAGTLGVKPFESSIDGFVRVRCVVTGLRAEDQPALCHAKSTTSSRRQRRATKGIMPTSSASASRRLEVKALAPTGTTRVLDVKGIELADAITSRNEVMKTQWKAGDRRPASRTSLGVLLPVPLILCAFLSEDYASLTSADAWCDLGSRSSRPRGAARPCAGCAGGTTRDALALLMWIAALAAHAHTSRRSPTPSPTTTAASANADDVGGARADRGTGAGGGDGAEARARRRRGEAGGDKRA